MIYLPFSTLPPAPAGQFLFKLPPRFLMPAVPSAFVPMASVVGTEPQPITASVVVHPIRGAATTTQNAIDLFEVMKSRKGRRTTVIASQLEPNK